MIAFLVVLIAVGFAGWSATLIFLSKSMLPMANALNVLLKANQHIDDRIREVVERVQARQGRLPQPKVYTPAAREEPLTTGDHLRDVFGGDLLSPVEEQPDPSQELVE